MKVKDPIFFITGATGTGKSSLAVHIARALREKHHYDEVVIVNCDVMQFYRDLPIATNKVAEDDMHGIPHVFIGFLNSDDSWHSCPYSSYDASFGKRNDNRPSSPPSTSAEPFTVHAYADRVTQFVKTFFQRQPNGAIIICGGTCYYLQSVLFANTLVNDSSSSDDDDAENGGLKGESAHQWEGDPRAMWSRLNDVDPASAQRYHPNDTRRIKRLLDIYDQKGIPPSALFASRTTKLRFPCESTFVVQTHQNRASLYAQLRKRVDTMVAQGLLAEVREFKRWVRAEQATATLCDAIGFREFVHLPDSAFDVEDSAPLAEAVEQVKKDTIRYARKQERWLRNRITELLRCTSPPLPISHFVQAELSNAAEHAKAADDIVSGLFESRESYDSLLITLPLSVEGTAKAPVSQSRCESCDVVVYGRDQMEAHLRSKRHRGTLKRQKLEKDHLEKYGRVMPHRRPKREK